MGVSVTRKWTLTAQKGRARTGHEDPCGVPTQGKHKNLIHLQEKSSCSKEANLMVGNCRLRIREI